MTLRSGLRNNRKNELGAVVVGGIGSFLQNYVKSTQDRQQMDLANKQQALTKQRTDEEARANKVLEEWRTKEQIRAEKKFEEESGKDAKAAQKSADNYTTKMLMFNEMDLTPEELKEARARLKNVGVLGKVEDQNKVVDEVIKKHYTPEKTAKENDKGAGGVTRSEANVEQERITSNELENYKVQAADLKDQLAALPMSDTTGAKTINEKLAELKKNVYPTQRFENPGALSDSLYNAIPRLSKLRGMLKNTDTTAPAIMNSRGASVATTPVTQSQTEPAYEGTSDETNAKAIGLLQKMQAGGETIDSVIADFKANQAAYEAAGITEQMIYDVFGKAQ